MINGEKDYEYIQVGGNQGLPMRTPLNEVQIQNSPTPTNIIQPSQGAVADMIQQGQVSNVQQGTSGQINASDLMSEYPDYATGYDPLGQDPNVAAYDDAIRAQQAATSPGALAPQTYAPGLGRSTAVGGYSGSMIGNTTLFAPTGRVVPLGLVDAREKALQDAALKAAELKQKKAAKEAELNVLEIPKTPELSDKNYQKAYNKEFNTWYNDTVAEAKKLYKKDWKRALKDPSNAIGRDFQQKLGQFQYIAERGNQLTNKMADWMDLEEKGELYLPEDTKKKVYDAYNRLGDWKNADITDLYGLEREITKDIDINKYFKDTGILSDKMYQVDEEIKRGAGSISSDQWNTFTKETIEPKAREVARMLKETRFSGDAYSEEDIYKNIMSRYADRNKVKAQFQSAGARANKYYEEKEDRSVVYQDENSNFQIPGDTEDKWEDGYNIQDAEGIPGGIQPGDKVKLVEANVIVRNPDGSISRDSRGNVQYRSQVTWAVKRKEKVASGFAGMNAKEEEVNYTVTAPADGDSRSWMKKNHKSQYNALQDLSKDANIRTTTGVEEEEYEDPNRGNRNTRQAFDIEKSKKGSSGGATEVTDKEVDDFFSGK